MPHFYVPKELDLRLNGPLVFPKPHTVEKQVPNLHFAGWARAKACSAES